MIIRPLPGNVVSMARPHDDPDLDRRIVLAVFELVARHGVDGLGMRLLAESTGLSTGTLNYRFGNKRGLLDAAVDYAYQPPPNLFDDGGSAASALSRVLGERYVLRRAKVRLWWRFYSAISAHASKDVELAHRLSANHRALVGFFADILAQGNGSGELLVEQTNEEAERLVALAHGLALWQLVDPERIESAERIFRREITSLLRESHDRATLAP